jgi:hypothetical protein
MDELKKRKKSKKSKKSNTIKNVILINNDI